MVPAKPPERREYLAARAEARVELPARRVAGKLETVGRPLEVCKGDDDLSVRLARHRDGGRPLIIGLLDRVVEAPVRRVVRKREAGAGQSEEAAGLRHGVLGAIETAEAQAPVGP